MPHEFRDDRSSLNPSLHDSRSQQGLQVHETDSWDGSQRPGERRSRSRAGRASLPGLEEVPRQPARLCWTPALCPTPYALGLVCGRGERELPGWRCARDSSELLGPYANMMASTAQYVFDVIAGGGGAACVRLLSAADGVADDRQLDVQARYVPTSVMLAHAFAASAGGWQDQRTLVCLFGADVRNVSLPWWQPQGFPWQLPRWLQHRFVSLDNTRDMAPQLYAGSQCQGSPLFDVVLVRQGLCFCDDPSKTSQTWPTEIIVSRAQHSAVCGIYQLEPWLCEGRPAYRKGPIVLQWCPLRWEWAALDAAGGAWAFVRGDVGHPVLARGPWTVWDGAGHVADASLTCELVQGAPPWQRPPPYRMCCCGVPGDSASVLGLLQRVAALLDPHQPHSFGLLHGAWTNGTRTEVQQLHQQLEEAVRLFNEVRQGVHAAALLRRTAAKEYWLQCDGIILFQPSSRADPFRVYGGAPPECPTFSQ